MEFLSINIACILVHISAIGVIWKKWRTQAILHPGLYFSGLWLVSTISQSLSSSFDLMPTPNESAIYELNVYAAFTSFIFILMSNIGKKGHTVKPTFYLVDNNIRFIKILITIALISTITTFVSSGASFDFNANRADIISDQSHMSRSYTLLDSILAVCNTTLPFVTIVVGYCLGVQLATDEKKMKTIWIVLPLAIAFISAMTQGGRIAVLTSIRNYIIGIGFALPLYTIPKSKIFKLLGYTSLCAFIFLSFISIIGESRADYTGYEYGFSRFGIFSGVVDYMTSHYWGFQLRRIDYANDINLYYGINTFYGFLDFRIPFSASLGLNGNIWDILGFNYDPYAIYKSGVEGCFTTSSQFMPLIADFGTKGAYIVIIFLVYITQMLFLSVINNPKRNAISLVFFYMFFSFWFGSNFNGGFMSLYTVLLAAFLFDFIRKVYSK